MMPAEESGGGFAEGVPEPEETIPWPDVKESRFNAKLQKQHAREKIHYQEVLLTATCSGCGRQGDDLASFFFESPEWTWKRECGMAGWMVVCDRCHRHVAFHLTVMS